MDKLDQMTKEDRKAESSIQRPSQQQLQRPTSRRKVARSPSKTRSKLGCLTCKQKHVKCDETRPTCHKCTDKGWDCLGYPRDLKWSYKHQRSQPPAPSKGSGPGSTKSVLHDTRHESPGPSDTLLPTNPQCSDATKPTDALSKGVRWLESSPRNCPGNSERPLVIDCQRHGLGMVFSSPAEEVMDWLQNYDNTGNFNPQNTAHWVDLDQEDLLLTADMLSLNPEGFSLPAEDSSPTTLTLSPYFPPDIVRQPTPDPALRLIDLWFQQVCPAWSGFDSDLNLNRKLAEELWSKSETVYNSLQCMAASFLSARMPHMRSLATERLRAATACIQAEFSTLDDTSRLDVVPVGLIFSLLGLGTTVCWLDASRVGTPFLDAARSIICRSSQASSNTQPEIIMFFQKSLTYWEMLVSVVDDVGPGIEEVEMDNSGAGGNVSYYSQQGADLFTLDMCIHPWTGISATISRLFALTMRHCHAYRRLLTRSTGWSSNSAALMEEVAKTQKLEEHLLGLDLSPNALINDTGDWRTPSLHLAHVAEAYQLASLLQLYMTFPKLVSLRLPGESSSLRHNEVPWDKWVTPLALRLVQVLERIPPDSGSRVMQPLLYICASTGLRLCHGLPSEVASGSSAYNTPKLGARLTDITSDMLDYVNHIDLSTNNVSGPDTLPSLNIDIAIARSFVMKRLSNLESTLQPKPIIVAEQLVTAIWEAYDEETGCNTTHWLDVMEKKGLRSLFG